MDHTLEEQRTQLNTAAGLPWHKPSVECLAISLETGEAKNGSTEDGPGAFNRSPVTGPD